MIFILSVLILKMVKDWEFSDYITLRRIVLVQGHGYTKGLRN